MINSDNKSSIKKIYTISSEQLAILLTKLPSLQANNKVPEFLLAVQAEGSIIPATNKSGADKKSINLKFSYDFVQSNWFMSDQRVELLDESIA